MVDEHNAKHATGMLEPGGPGGGGGGGGGYWPPISGKSLNLIPIKLRGGGRFCPSFNTGTPKFFHLPASLHF